MSLETTNTVHPKAGYTLPVFACAGAIAAFHHLVNADNSPQSVRLDLIRPQREAAIAIEQVARLPDGSALAITRSDPGDNLDLTRNTPIWSVVNWGSAAQAEPICLEGGAGIGRQINADDQAAIYAYAHNLFQENLLPLLETGQRIRVTIILPEGKKLALRTSNEAFGVVDGLSLLGISGISEPLSAPGQLALLRQIVREKAAQFESLVFCIGENGLDRALSLGIPPEQRVKTANWLGPLLVEAALGGVQGILLLGYHGKLIKLAGGIFHTHHHVADGRQEILTAIAAAQGLSTDGLQQLLQAETVEAGLAYLSQLDTVQKTDWVSKIYGAMVERIDQRAIAYIQTHGAASVTVGTAVFDRQRAIIAISQQGRALLRSL
ncbi:MAG: cobalt-precorrin-5B (C(1))-methyltransferase CbiD [Cyanobacteria bacterium P01_H01_bin.58]